MLEKEWRSALSVKRPVSLLPEVIDQIEASLETIQKLQSVPPETVQKAISHLEQARGILVHVERQYLESLGVPENYIRSTRIRLSKELMSWEFRLPFYLLGIAASIWWWVTFARRLNLFDLIFLLFLVTVVMVITHEGLHAIPAYLFGRVRPGFKLRFGSFGRLGAYTALNCVLPRAQYLVIALTPLIGITLFGGLLWVLMPNWAFWISAFMVVNAVGSCGDLWISWHVIHSHPQALFLDSDYEMAVFEPQES